MLKKCIQGTVRQQLSVLKKHTAGWRGAGETGVLPQLGPRKALLQDWGAEPCTPLGTARSRGPGQHAGQVSQGHEGTQGAKGSAG